MMQDWFRNAKLGIFIHYGIYAVGDVSESWSFHNGNISYEDYMKQCEGFTASKFDAKKWAELFQKAGAQYVVMTAKHHDGVALFDTGYSDLSVVKKTPAARDLVKEYTAAMREAGLKVGLYYSLIDWSDPRYRTVYPEGMKKEDCLNDIYGSPAGKEEEPQKWQEFLEFNNHQLKELMSNYGTVDLLWFDGDWERSAAQWKMPEFREYLHTLNPNVVLNSRMQGYGDYETPEQGIPLYGPKGEWEFCTTINDSWGYRPSDNDYKSSGQIVRMFCDCITLGGRMLLDIGPKEDGTLDERQEQVLLDLGIVNRSNYYTGVIFRGYVQGSGLTVLSGGRYDNLLGEFGTDKPAIGFAVDVSAVTDVLHEEINLDRPLRIALTKGRLEKASVQMFKTMGLNTEVLENKGRRLILPVDPYEAVLSKAPDVITYVEHGVCDIGIVGKDTIVEHGSAFYEVLDLNIGRCAFALATKKGTDFFSGYKRKTVASKYPKVAKEFFKSKGMDVDVIKIEGSVELAPLLGLADGIVDIVETGSTLKENGLEVVEKIMPISARVIVNMASMKLRKDEIEAFLHDIELAAQVG